MYMLMSFHTQIPLFTWDNSIDKLVIENNAILMYKTYGTVFYFQ